MVADFVLAACVLPLLPFDCLLSVVWPSGLAALSCSAAALRLRRLAGAGAAVVLVWAAEVVVGLRRAVRASFRLATWASS